MVNMMKLVVPGLLFITTLASGVWLTHSGKPLNVLLFTLHKLIALGAVVSAAVWAVRLARSANTTPAAGGWMAAVAIVCILALFASGALMSANKLNYEALHWVHRIAPVLLGLSAAGFFALLLQIP